MITVVKWTARCLDSALIPLHCQDWFIYKTITVDVDQDIYE